MLAITLWSAGTVRIATRVTARVNTYGNSAIDRKLVASTLSLKSMVTYCINRSYWPLSSPPWF